METKTATELDPVTFTVMRHRLDEIIAEAYHTMGRVSGSPVVYEAGDHQEAIGTPSGDLAVFGAGVLHWTMSLRSGFKHVISEYAENPGIRPDDQFLLNDAYIASIHSSDIQVLAPVFYDGELIAWAGSASHQTDIGGVDPGGHHVSATEFFQEGFQTPGLKIVEGGVVRRDIELTFANMVRAPELGLLDIRAKIASNNTIKQRLGELVDKYGIETVKALFDGLINYSEERIGQKLRDIPDGRWTASNYLEGIADPQLKVEVTAIKEGGRLTLDFTGTGPQTAASESIGPTGAMSSAMCPFIFTLAHDIPWNDGLFRNVDFVLPEGSLVNPRKPAALSCSVPSGANIVVQTATHQVLSKMALASGSYQEEASADSTACFNNHVLTGIREADGSFFAMVILDSLAGGVGARPVADGANTSGNEWAVKTMVANVETNEQLYPLMYLWRRETPDSGGPGEFRGGVGLEGAIIPWGTAAMGNVGVGAGHVARLTLGVGGGYPGARTPAGIVRGADVANRLFAAGRLAVSSDDLTGDYEAILAKGLSTIDREDALVSFLAGGGGGFGDPIDRDPEAVLRDVADGYVTAAAAAEMYGVVLAGDAVDLAATERRREEILAERLARASAAGAPTEHPELALRQGETSCRRCGEELKLATFETPINVGEPEAVRDVPSELVLRHECCANCGRLMHVDQAIGATG